MTTDGIEAVFLETHNWGKTAKFLQALGYELEFDTGHNSGQLRNGDGPYVFVAEVPESRETGTPIVFRVDDAAAFTADPIDPIVDIPVGRIVAMQFAQVATTQEAEVVERVPADWLLPYVHQRYDDLSVLGKKG